jgi:ligand-binding sensor domain-containing protein
MYGGVAMKENGNWTIHNTFTTGYPFLSAQCVDVDVNGNIWAGSLNGLAMYDGFTWTQFTHENSPLYSSWITDIMFQTGTTNVWVSTGAGVFRVDVSDAHNLVWECYLPNNSNLSTGFVTNLFLDSNDKIWAGSQVGLFSYENEEWISHNSQLGEIDITKITEDEYGRFWIGTYGEGVIMWDGDETETITVENSCLVSNLITAIGCDKMGTLWVSSNNGGLYSCEYSSTGIEDTQVVSYPQIDHNNYPNPFNPETTIQFSLPEAGYVDIDIFNVKGQKVKSLLQSQLSDGKHSIAWNGTDKNGNSVSSGTYFYRIMFNNQAYSRKMMLLK